MVNSAWSGQLEVEFLLQVFTTVKRALGWSFGFVFVVRKNAARSDRRRRPEAPLFPRRWMPRRWMTSTAYDAPGAPIEGYPLGVTSPGWLGDEIITARLTGLLLVSV
jgi:hypothetical protein